MSIIIKPLPSNLQKPVFSLRFRGNLEEIVSDDAFRLRYLDFGFAAMFSLEACHAEVFERPVDAEDECQKYGYGFHIESHLERREGDFPIELPSREKLSRRKELGGTRHSDD